MLFYPWKKEKEDLQGNSDSYEAKYNECISVINAHKKMFEMDNGITDLMEKTLINSYENYVFAPKFNMLKK